jgi:hypothetical protein
MRYLQIHDAIGQVIHQTYGVVPGPVLEDITAAVVMAVILEQAYTEKAWRDVAERADLPPLDRYLRCYDANLVPRPSRRRGRLFRTALRLWVAAEDLDD